MLLRHFCSFQFRSAFRLPKQNCFSQLHFHFYPIKAAFSSCELELLYISLTYIYELDLVKVRMIHNIRIYTSKGILLESYRSNTHTHTHTHTAEWADWLRYSDHKAVGKNPKRTAKYKPWWTFRWGPSTARHRRGARRTRASERRASRCTVGPPSVPSPRWRLARARLDRSPSAEDTASDESSSCILRSRIANYSRTILHRVSKNVPPLACYNFDTHEWILIFFVRNVTDKVSNQNMFYCVTSNNICFCTTWQNGETRKLHFSLKCCITALPEFNQLLDFFSLFDSYSRCCMTP